MNTHKVFTDTETTGFDNNINQILTVAIVIHNDKKEEVFAEEYKVKKMPWSIVSPGALECNGINIEEHNKTALSEREVCLKIVSVLNQFDLIEPVIIGQNIKFDIKFLRSMFSRAEVDYPFIGFEDTMAMARQLKISGNLDIPNVKLATIAGYFGLTTDFHRALEDTKMTAQVYYKLYDMINKD